MAFFTLQFQIGPPDETYVLSTEPVPIPNQPVVLSSGINTPPMPWEFWSDGMPNSGSHATPIASGGSPACYLSSSQNLPVVSAGGTPTAWTYSDPNKPQTQMTDGDNLALGALFEQATETWILAMLEPGAHPWDGMRNWTRTLLDCNSLITTIVNMTTKALSVTARATEGLVGLSGRIPLAPKSSVAVVSSYQSGLETAFQIWDDDYSTANSVASFDVHQHECRLLSGEIWVKPIDSIAGYAFEPMQTSRGSPGDTLPGMVTATLTLRR